MAGEQKTVMLYCNSLHKGGAERVFAQLAERFAAEGWRSILVTSYADPGREEYPLSEQVTRYNMEPQRLRQNFIKRNLSRIAALRRLCKKEKPDILITCMQEPNFRAMLASALLPVKRLVSVCNAAEKEYPGLGGFVTGKLLMPLAEGCVFQTEEEKDEEEPASIPELTEGQAIFDVKGRVTEHWTKPPKAYTEDSLLAAMERAGSADMDNNVERKGLGTPATRASIIEKLIASGYAVRKKRQIIATEGGAKMTALMPDYLKSVQMTADWENRLLQMERGETSAEDFMTDIYALIDRILVSCKEVPEDMRKRHAEANSKDKEEIGKCPVCGGSVIEGKNKYFCSNRDCSFVLWKENRFLSSMKKTVSKKMAVELLTKGKTRVKDLFSAKTGKTFEADLLMTINDGKPSFSLEFPQRKTKK